MPNPSIRLDEIIKIQLRLEKEDGAYIHARETGDIKSMRKIIKWELASLKGRGE